MKARAVRIRRECDICGWAVPINLEGCQRTELHWAAKSSVALTTEAWLTA